MRTFVAPRYRTRRSATVRTAFSAASLACVLERFSPCKFLNRARSSSAASVVWAPSRTKANGTEGAGSSMRTPGFKTLKRNAARPTESLSLRLNVDPVLVSIRRKPADACAGICPGFGSPEIERIRWWDLRETFGDRHHRRSHQGKSKKRRDAFHSAHSCRYHATERA
jgi:hypothetical protein